MYRGKEREEGRDKEGKEEIMNKKVLFSAKCKWINRQTDRQTDISAAIPASKSLAIC